MIRNIEFDSGPDWIGFGIDLSSGTFIWNPSKLIRTQGQSEIGF